MRREPDLHRRRLVEVIEQTAYEDRRWASDMLEGVAVLLSKGAEAARSLKNLDEVKRMPAARRRRQCRAEEKVIARARLAKRDRQAYILVRWKEKQELPMTLMINLPPEKEAVFKAEAQLRGLSVEQWLVEVADHHVQPADSIAHLQKTDPQEWARRFDEWVNSHDPNTPVLSDEAMSRDSIYPDRS